MNDLRHCNSSAIAPPPVRYAANTPRIAALLAVLSLFVSGCSGIGSFEITRESSEKTVESSVVGEVNDRTPLKNPFKFDIDLDQELEERDAKGAKRVTLQELTFEVTDSDDNFNFLNSVVLFANADGEDRKKLAWRDPVPEDRKEFDFEVDSGVNLKPYIQKGLELQTEAEYEPPSEDRSFKGIITLEIETL